MIALFPSPLDENDAPLPPPGSQEDEEKALTAARARLGRAWSRLGFQHYRDGTWILDPGMRTLHDALCRERQRLQDYQWNVTFTDTPDSGSIMSAGISKVTMAKSAPHPLRTAPAEGP
ncbi:hypothetical protein ACPB9E_36780 [Streptomyces exfoliatus]|uniref:hypothetical protein n=1 Tax=Streptomyces exfoliatus TaxID=1905 RepID=UPI003C2E5F2B